MNLEAAPSNSLDNLFTLKNVQDQWLSFSYKNVQLISVFIEDVAWNDIVVKQSETYVAIFYYQLKHNYS